MYAVAFRIFNDYVFKIGRNFR